MSLKLPLVVIISLIFALIVYFVNIEFSDTSFGSYLPSIFILLCSLSLILTSKAINSDQGIVTAETTQTNDDNPQAITTLYIGNIAYKANEQLILDHFANAGAVKSVRLVKDKKTGRRKGFGFIEISSKDEAKFIKQFNDSTFMDRNLIVRLANEKQY